MNGTEKTVLTQKIGDALRKEGFSIYGFAHALTHPEDTAHLNTWIDRGRHGGLGYLVRNRDKIGDITAMVEHASSVIMAGLPYRRNNNEEAESGFFISRYAQVKDYHLVITTKLKRIARLIGKEVPGSVSRVFCDTSSVTEKEWAIRAGLGWRGKHSIIINEDIGSFFFLGGLVTTVPLVYNKAQTADRCGTCRRCIDACPTGAICNDRTIDVKRCIAYMTIEKFEDIPDWFRGKIENMIYGCDRCQEVCPWNSGPAHSIDKELEPSFDVNGITREQWLTMMNDEFDNIFATSAMKFAGLEKIRKTIDFIESTSSEKR
jgi:epoxyqueuosine reductase